MILCLCTSLVFFATALKSKPYALLLIWRNISLYHLLHILHVEYIMTSAHISHTLTCTRDMRLNFFHIISQSLILFRIVFYWSQSFASFAPHHSGGKYILINSFALTMSLGAQLCTSDLKQSLNKENRLAKKFYWKQLWNCDNSDNNLFWYSTFLNAVARHCTNKGDNRKYHSK